MIKKRLKIKNSIYAGKSFSVLMTKWITLLESWIILTLSAPNLSEYSLSNLWEISDKPVSFGSL